MRQYIPDRMVGSLAFAILAFVMIVTLVMFIIGLPGCNSVLGYNEATVDPNLPAGGEAGTTSQSLTCDSYCADIMKNCTGTQAEYLNADICKLMCSHFDVGLPGDTMEDSLGCRSFHAAAAATNPVDHCKHAGPMGGGHCGSDPCVPFCALDAALCTGSDQPYPGGELACRKACVNYTYHSGPTDEDISEGGGSTLNCRMWHLESAYDPSNPAAKTTHCPHTGQMSTTCF